ncbi:hypothetical protein EVAR_98809_1, partial [Eumeta japonica]
PYLRVLFFNIPLAYHFKFSRVILTKGYVLEAYERAVLDGEATGGQGERPLDTEWRNRHGDRRRLPPRLRDHT